MEQKNPNSYPTASSQPLISASNKQLPKIETSVEESYFFWGPWHYVTAFFSYLIESFKANLASPFLKMLFDEANSNHVEDNKSQIPNTEFTEISQKPLDDSTFSPVMAKCIPKLPDDFCYSINLMWINTQDSNGVYICDEKNKEGMNYELKQLKKWCTANPEAQINFWYDSVHTTLQAVENTKNLLLTEYSSSNNKINLRDIREIPFVQWNSDLFQSTVPVYFRIDFLKLIICVHCMESDRHHSSIFSDFSIGDKVEKVLSKNELYNEEMLNKLEQFGMLVGQDGGKTENQFLQMMSSPSLLISVKHAINCCLLMIVNTLNSMHDGTVPSGNNLGGLSFTATMTYVHTYFLLLKNQETVKIRADIVNEGNQNEWKDYDPELNNYIMFGNVYNERLQIGMHINPDASSDPIDLDDTINFNSKYGHPSMGPSCVPRNAVRKDLNPGHRGRNHYGSFDDVKSTNEKFVCKFWSLNSPKNDLTLTKKI